MEYRDLYDEQGNLTNEIISKGEICPANRRLLVAAIVIENNDSKLLIQKRSMYKDSLWSFTSGHVETKESSIEGIIREAKEELGLNLSKDDIITFNKGINKKYIFNSYYIKQDIELNNLTLQLEEVEDAKWLSLNEIKELIENGRFKQSHINIFNDYLKYFNRNCKSN
jgi:8-oxo-dGTP pyrophosphatase MutT (NUDIX family)